MDLDYKNRKILIVDDTTFMRAGLIKILLEMGLTKTNIYQCEDGIGAVEVLRKTDLKFDIILSDWNMPNMNGLELLKHVRSSASYVSGLPFILITTVSEKDKVIEAINYKVTGYLLKPVVRASLEENFERIFEVEPSDE